MNRNAGLMVLCVALGAAVMYGGSHFRVSITPAGAPQQPPAPELKIAPARAPAAGAPAPLPPSVTKPDTAPRADPQVKPAGFADAKPAPVRGRTLDDTQAGAKWDLGAPPPGGVPTVGTSVTITFDKALGKDELLVSTNDPAIKDKVVPTDDALPGVKRSAPGATPATVVLDLTKLTATNGVLALEFRVKVADNPATSDPYNLALLVPTPGPTRTVFVNEFSTSPFLALGPSSGLTAPTKYAEVYGKPQFEPYLRLSGAVSDGASELRFFMQPDGNEPAFEVEAEPASRISGGVWDYQLKLPVRAERSTGKLFVRAEFANGRANAPAAVPVRFNYIPLTLDAPVLTLPPKDTAGGAALSTNPAPAPLGTADLPAYFTKSKTFALEATAPGNAQVLIHYHGSETPKLPPGATVPGLEPDGGRKAVFVGTGLGDGDHVVRVAAARGRFVGAVAQVKLIVRTQPLVVEEVVPATGFGQSKGVGTEKIVVRFNAKNPIDPTTLSAGNFAVVHNENADRKDLAVSTVSFDALANAVTLNVGRVLPGTYKVAVLKSPVLKDVYGNALAHVPNLTDDKYAFEATVSTQQSAGAGEPALPSVRAGVTLQTGPPSVLPEYTKPRAYPEGFNPSDRVETRVMRLYYFRDAHRVAQLVNRTVKSYNVAAVDVRRRAADRARDDADKAEDERKGLERAAVRAAQEARAAEGELAAVQNRLATAKSETTQAQARLAQKRFQLQQTPPTDTALAQQLQFEIGQLERMIVSFDSVERRGAGELATAQAAVTAKRDTESKAVEAWQVKELQERRYRENQYRREVGAAKEDPDTYAPAQPESVDPVLQVSISVIGEGLIQLRGPIKGLNVIRTMVNQIDAPVGQVRVAVHTLQVNGERADRMETVIHDIQRYLDHSRFLTAQSSQMLRRAVTSVAARKANEAAQGLAPGCTQWDRDQKYLHAFFGKDFIDELILLDSEFLKTGNKLLGLHSMDSTSLSAALFLMALAKNDVRAEIIQEFLAYVQRDLPQAEWNYYAAGFSDPKWKHCGACKDKKQYLLAYNSKFQSFIGFFTSETDVADTLSPLQREFLKLAQIFKARMITEMQLKQRVMERALLEERFGPSYKKLLEDARQAEDEAKKAVQGAEEDASKTRIDVAAEFLELFGAVAGVEKSIDGFAAHRLIDEFVKQANNRPADRPLEKDTGALDVGRWEVARFEALGNQELRYRLRLGDKPGVIELVLHPEWHHALAPGAKLILDQLDNFNFVTLARESAAVRKLLARIQPKVETTAPLVFGLTELADFRRSSLALRDSIATATVATRQAADQLLSQLLVGDEETTRKVIDNYHRLKADLLTRVQPDSAVGRTTKRVIDGIDAKLRVLSQNNQKVILALRKAQQARRPLDEKKLLDMMVDELEDKFIEILEGTRAHTANIDNYMKTITTALDDDFNTQYYLPSFRRARDASRSWDVTLAQIETTSVLANNRTFAKVSPAATFEFDLPKRDILLTEGFKSAKALMDEYGALVNDPSFLALTKMYSGNPVSMMQGGSGGLAAVRNVLPGLPSSADERIMAQAGPGRKEFGSSLEALIPDPAIYKFETGTGYEIRPVLSPDGQAVVFNFDYMYTTDVREPVRADEKHLGRVKRHYVHTDVQLSNFELREVSKYTVALKAARTAKGVQLLQDIPGVGALFRPLPSAGSALQQNLIYSQATIFPTLFDLMGLRYAPAVADLDPLADRMGEFAARYRRLDLEQRVYDIGASRVDDALRTPYGERRYDLYRPQLPLPYVHPNGYYGMGLRTRDGVLREGYSPHEHFRGSEFNPNISGESRPLPYDYRTPYGPAQYPYTLPHGYPLGQPREGHPLANPRELPGGGAVRPNVPGGGPTDAMLRDPRVPINYGRPVPVPSNPARELPATSLPPVVTPSLPPLPGAPTALPPLPR